MAGTPTIVLAEGGGSAGAALTASDTTATAKPTDGEAVIIFLMLRNGTTTDVQFPTMTAFGGTPTLMNVQRRTGVAGQRIGAYRLHEATYSTTDIAFTQGDTETWDWWNVAAVEVSGLDVTGTNAENAFAYLGGHDVFDTSISEAISMAGSAGAISHVGLYGGTDAITPRTDWTEIHDAQGGGGGTFFKHEVQYRLAADTAQSAAWTNSLTGLIQGYELIDGAAIGTAAVTGTVVSAPPTEADIVAGGKTIIITLTGDVWVVAAGGLFDAERQAIIDGLDSAQAEGTGWNAEVRDNLAVTDVVRTSDTVVTITLSAQAAYDIIATETITVTVPSTATLLNAGAIVASPTFTVTPDATGAAVLLKKKKAG